MASTRNVIVNFVTKLSGRGIENLSRQSRGLERSLGLLQKRLIAIVSFTAFFRYIKNSTKAFAEETGKVKQLELALNNLGLAYTALTIDDTIQRLQRLTAVSDDELRPALAQLVRQTADVAKATELLELAINVSIGSGKSLSTVSRALGRAYDGQTTALRRLDAGLSAAAIESKDFNVIQAELQDKFGGAAAADLTTYAGKMRALAVASEQASENIGEGVLKGLAALSGGDFQRGLELLVTLSERIGRGFELAGRGAARLRALISAPFQGLEGQTTQAELTGRFRAQDIALDAAERKAQIADVDRRYKLERKSLKELARQKQVERSKDKTEDRRKAAAKAAEKRQDDIKKRLEEKFDIDAINLTAALTRKLSEEDQARVKALQALRSDANKDDEAALNRLMDLERKLAEDKLKAAAADIALSTVVKNQRLADLDAEIQALKAVSAARAAAIAGANISWDTARAAISMGTATDNQEMVEAGIKQLNMVMFQDLDASRLAELESLRAEELAAQSATSAAGLAATAGAAAQVVVNQYISGNVVTQQELFDTFQNQLFESNRAGIPGQLELLGR
jgi:hypothetical protein